MGSVALTGMVSWGGCAFHNVASFNDETAQQLSVKKQLSLRATQINWAKRYLACFQVDTNTYAK